MSSEPCAGCGAVHVTAEEWAALEASIAAEKEARAALWPDAKAVAGAMMELFTRLGDMGWQTDIRLAPKDGKPFQVMQFGSSGIFQAFRGEDGFVWVEDGGDLWPGNDSMAWYRAGWSLFGGRKLDIASLTGESDDKAKTQENKA